MKRAVGHRDYSTSADGCSDGNVMFVNVPGCLCIDEDNLPLRIRGNYLIARDTAAAMFDAAARATAGLREILHGLGKAFRTEIACALRCILMRVARTSNGDAQFVVLTYADITEMKRAEVELHRVSTQLMKTQDDERRRIAREIHDTTVQNLVAAKLQIDQLRADSIHPGDTVASALHLAQSLLVQSLEELRTLSYLMHPPMLDELGLVPAVRWYARGFEKRSGVRVTVDAPEEVLRLSGDIESTLFRVVQEGLVNVHRHSGSRDVDVVLQWHPERITLEIVDHGIGMPLLLANGGSAERAQMGVGIPGMRLRLQQIGGSLEIASTNRGTTLCAAVPRAAPARCAIWA